MKALLILIPALGLLSACANSSDSNRRLQTQVDSLKKKLDSTYRPGLGEFMMGIQEHHAKLWFAGLDKNWELADFEVHEIGETIGDIKQYCTDRPEVKSIGIIDPAISSISSAIKQKDEEAFKKGFAALTDGCNNCHRDNNHGFNVITIPTGLPVTNQQFKPAK
ncbi:MAG: hypothetical protein JST19_20760 [Bacteroidetes bacterium]|nr:hypothetical protein [Bacteroidota bacterium]